MKRIILSLLVILGLIAPAHAQYRGALMTLTTPQTVPGSYGTAHFLYPKFDNIVRDTDSLIDNDPASPGYHIDMVIPPTGVSLVEFTCSMVMDYVPEDTARAQILVTKWVNNAPQFFIGVQPTNGRSTTYTTTDWAARTAVIAVQPGERYRCQVWQARGPANGTTSLTSIDGNWFQATILQ